MKDLSFLRRISGTVLVLLLLGCDPEIQPDSTDQNDIRESMGSKSKCKKGKFKNKKCSDDSKFVDAQGYSCSHWTAFDCNRAEEMGYDSKQAKKIKDKCKKSCGLCPVDLQTCYGYRGNGSSVFSTIGGIARLFDQYKAPDAVVGTSSGSVAAFLTESIMVPNAVYECPNCSQKEISERRSFMLKAFPLSIKAVSESDGLKEDFEKIEQAKEVYETIAALLGGIGLSGAEDGESGEGLSLPDSEEVKAVLNAATLTILKTQSVELKNFIAPEYYKISGVGGTPDPGLVDKAIGNLLMFQGITDGSEFTRQRLMYPGVVNFDYIFELVGVVADWFAGYGTDYPAEHLSVLLDHCASQTRGKWWNTIAEKAYNGSDCGTAYYRLFKKYFNDRKKNSTGKKRIDEPMGVYIPAFVSTSAISENRTVASMNAWADAGDFDRIDELDLGRKNFKVLYFGPDNYKDMINRNRCMYKDVVTKNIVSMGSVSWLMGMKASGQEPATARAMTFTLDGEDYLSTGGYVDQLQSKLMRMIGCKQTVAINNNEPIFGFANRYSSKIWNLDQNLVMDLLDPDDPKSAESIAFEETDALLCARWNGYGISETWEMADNAYHNFLFTEEADLLLERALFTRLDGEITTTEAPPKTCYDLPDERGEQFPPYTVSEE